jgi:thiamine pyrophosphate-dependent acetolactate synthase large subunit-like protein
MNVSDLTLQILQQFGVSHLFGIPGDAINDVTEAIRHNEAIRFVQVRHEETGAFAASAQAKLTGQLSVCLGTAGPGAVHLLNGLYDAKMDHAPVLAITGHVDTKYIGTDYHQEIDLYSLFSDVAVFNQIVTSESQLPHILVQACQKAIAYRSVAHVSLPVDIASRRVPGDAAAVPVTTQFGRPVPCEQDLAAAAAILSGAQRIAILAGIGCADARHELVSFADKLGAPIIRTLRAKEVLPDGHPLCAGGLGQLGTEPAVDAVDNCDALVLVGTDFPYHDYYPDGGPAIQIDIEPGRIGKRYPVEVGLHGDAGLTLRLLEERLKRKPERGFLETIQKRMQIWLEDQKQVEESDDVPIHPQRVARTVGELAGDDAIFVCDTGAVTVWGARHLRLRDGQRYTLSSALASMAFALPGAIGAQLAYPDRQVIALCGDGGFAMLMADFVTAVKYHLPITAVIFNNAKLGLIQMEQEAEGMPDYATDLSNPDFVAFAEACGGVGYRVSEPASLAPVLAEALSLDRPVIVDVAVDPDELTLPPKIKSAQAVNYGIAKVKEILAKE